MHDIVILSGLQALSSARFSTSRIAGKAECQQQGYQGKFSFSIAMTKALAEAFHHRKHQHRFDNVVTSTKTRVAAPVGITSARNTALVKAVVSTLAQNAISRLRCTLSGGRHIERHIVRNPRKP